MFGFLGTLFNYIIVYPLAYIMQFLYWLVPNYGVCLILFVLIVKTLMIPLAVKQQKGLMKQAVLAPKLREIQEKYRDDPRKMQEEQQKLRIEHGGSLFGGCLPLLIQFPIIFGLLEIVRNPLTNILGIYPDNIAYIAEQLNIAETAQNIQLQIISTVNSWTGALPDTVVRLFEHYGIPTEGSIFNLKFLFMDLGVTPDIGVPSLIWLIPLFSAGTSFLQSFVSQKFVLEESKTAQTKVMMFVSAGLSLFFSFMWPAALGFYWGWTSLYGTVQTYFLGKKYDPNKYKEYLEKQAKDEKARQKQLKKQQRLERQQQRLKELEEIKKKYSKK